MQTLQRKSIQTLAYFDLFDHPLTLHELARYTSSEASELEQALASHPRIEQVGGFYSLEGRGHVAKKRQHRIWRLEEKMKIARRGAKKLRWVPFVRGVFVCNTVAMGVPSPESDIDVVVLAAPGRLWTVRFFSNLVLKFFRLRTGSNAYADKICLSFFVDTDHLDLSGLAIEGDIYLSYWLATLVPIYDPYGHHQQWAQSNSWSLVPLTSYAIVTRWKVDDNQFQRMKRDAWEWLLARRVGAWFESRIKRAQRKKMAKRGLDPDGCNVVLRDSLMKFHENDRRHSYRDEWQERCEPFLSSV